MQTGYCCDGTMGSAKRPIGDCLEGLVQMLSPLFVQRTYPAGSFLVKQVSTTILLYCSVPGPDHQHSAVSAKLQPVSFSDAAMLALRDIKHC